MLSFTDADLIASDLVYRHVRGETSSVEFKPEHRWFYFSEMQRDEVLLWDQWGAITDRVADDLTALLLAADTGDAAAERALTVRYATDPALRLDGRVHCMSPSGFDGWVPV